ncbi:MAG TPA: sulfatase-like hydrolase/transferase, partial [Anaerolineae bacterium]|nr:sulfatase-like hydrolase/transferase [Anaerolineae bacterium]
MPPKPNLLFLFTDQQRFDTLKCYGNDRIQTPNLDALAGESCVFQNAYVTQPVCTPSRSSMLTGLYPHSNGCERNNLPLRPEIPTLAEMISDDYLCAYYGKWHLGDEVVAQHGFADWVSIEDYYRRFYSREEYLSLFSSYHQFLLDNGFEPDYERAGARLFDRVKTASLPEPYTKARFLGREAARFIRERGDGGQPFTLYVGFLEPHTPYVGPLGDLYPPEELPAAPHFRHKPLPNAALVNRMLADQYMDQGLMYGQDLTTDIGCRRTRSQYWGNVTLVDRAIGEILHALHETGQADHTIVVFTSDHGDMMGDHGLFEKCVFYDEAVRVPLLVRVPWLSQAPRTIPGGISQVDLVPTLLDLMGEPIPAGLQGQSRASVLSGESTLAENDVFIEWNGPDGRPARFFGQGSAHLREPLEATGREQAEEWQAVQGPWRSVVSGDGWKLNLSTTDQSELYDLNTDPHELHNRFHEPRQRGRIRDLTER